MSTVQKGKSEGTTPELEAFIKEYRQNKDDLKKYIDEMNGEITSMSNLLNTSKNFYTDQGQTDLMKNLDRIEKPIGVIVSLVSNIEIKKLEKTKKSEQETNMLPTGLTQIINPPNPNPNGNQTQEPKGSWLDILKKVWNRGKVLEPSSMLTGDQRINSILEPSQQILPQLWKFYEWNNCNLHEQALPEFFMESSQLAWTIEAKTYLRKLQASILSFVQAAKSYFESEYSENLFAVAKAQAQHKELPIQLRMGPGEYKDQGANLE